MTAAGLELRHGNVTERIVEGIVVPYGETSFLTPDPKGERFRPGSLTRSIQERGERIKLFRSHNHRIAVGKALQWKPMHEGGCWAQFQIGNTPAGDEVLTEVREGMLDSFSVGFKPVRETRGMDGAREIIEAELHEVSLCPIGAYDGARVLPTRAPSTDASLEWTTFDRRPDRKPKPFAVGETYWRERRRIELEGERRRHPDHAVMGAAIPYNVRLPDHNGDWLWFDTDTKIELDGRTIPLHLEHGALLGYATITEEFNGTMINGTIYNGMRHRVADRRQLSPRITDVATTRRPDGTLHVRQARVLEVSLVNSAKWSPHTDAVVFQRAVAA